MNTKHYIERIVSLCKIARNFARSARIGDIPSLRALINEAEIIVSEIEAALRANRGEAAPAAIPPSSKDEPVIDKGTPWLIRLLMEED